MIEPVPNSYKFRKIHNACISVYNITDNYIKSQLYTANQLNLKNKKCVNFINIRKMYKDRSHSICINTSIYKHTFDYAIKHCVSMYKSTIEK